MERIYCPCDRGQGPHEFVVDLHLLTLLVLNPELKIVSNCMALQDAIDRKLNPWREANRRWDCVKRVEERALQIAIANNDVHMMPSYS